MEDNYTHLIIDHVKREDTEGVYLLFPPSHPIPKTSSSLVRVKLRFFPGLLLDSDVNI
jgi:hypothetical protein